MCFYLHPLGENKNLKWNRVTPSIYRVYARNCDNEFHGLRELIQIASNKAFTENHKDKHNSKAKYGWYRYDTRFAVPKYDNDGELAGYSIFKGRLVIRHAQNGKLYLYDILRIKKETSEPLE